MSNVCSKDFFYISKKVSWTVFSDYVVFYGDVFSADTLFDCSAATPSGGPPTGNA